MAEKCLFFLPFFNTKISISPSQKTWTSFFPQDDSIIYFNVFPLLFFSYKKFKIVIFLKNIYQSMNYSIYANRWAGLYYLFLIVVILKELPYLFLNIKAKIRSSLDFLDKLLWFFLVKCGYLMRGNKK